MIEQKILSALQQEMESSPQSAVDRVSTLDDSIDSRQIKGSIFIDAGVMLGNAEVITKGIEIQQSLIAELPDYAHHFSYNLANGLFSLALITKRPDFSWYTETHKNRFEARKEFYNVTQYDTDNYNLKSKAYTNLANLLRESHRWVEAYEFYIEALKTNPVNAVASSGAAKLLYYHFLLGVGNKKETIEEIEELIEHALNNKSYCIAASGQTNWNKLKVELQEITDKLSEIDFDETTQNVPHQIGDKSLLSFCHKERLFLNLSLSYHKNFYASVCDDLCISSVSEKNNEDSLVPGVFKLLNLLKSDFILARHLLLQGIEQKIEETGRYDDTLDYSIYGVDSSAIITAQRVAVDLLDKIGVATRVYLDIGGAKGTDFQKFWHGRFKQDEQPIIHSKVLEEIKANNPSLMALIELSNDINFNEGYLKSKKDARNSSTHRFTVLHDSFNPKENERGPIRHFNYEQFISESISTLKIARSAIIYFVDMVDTREARLAKSFDGLTVTNRLLEY